jgi:hypothetical protein
MKMIKPRPTAPTRASRAIEARRIRSSMLPSAKLKLLSDREKACATLEATFTTIDSCCREHEGERRETPVLGR